VEHPEAGVSTLPHIPVLTFISYLVQHTWHCIHMPFWDQLSLFCTLSQLVERV